MFRGFLKIFFWGTGKKAGHAPFAKEKLKRLKFREGRAIIVPPVRKTSLQMTDFCKPLIMRVYKNRTLVSFRRRRRRNLLKFGEISPRKLVEMTGPFNICHPLIMPKKFWVTTRNDNSYILHLTQY